MKYLNTIFFIFALIPLSLQVPRYFDRQRLLEMFYNDQLMRVFGGSPADIKEYPYQVLLMIDGKPICGGSIIKEDFVLTAAHCIYDVSPSQLTIRAGSSDRTTGGQLVGIDRIYFPKDKFNIDTFDYDIAVLELEFDLIFGERVQPINLPDPTYEIKEDELAVATGWGQTDPDDSTLPAILQTVELPEITTESCRNYYGSLVTDRMFCAGYQQGGKDTCLGDSGGPLVADGILLGITSWGSDRCAQKGYPGVFTKVAYFTKNISSIISSVHSNRQF